MEDCIVLARDARRARGRRARASRSSSTSARPRGPTARTSPTCAAVSSRAARRDRHEPEPRARTSARTAIHPTAGATAIGARPFLVAYNVYLGGAANLAVAKDVAKAVRGSSGGLRYVKGLGLEVDGQAQVSMNLVDTEKTPLYRAFDAVKMEAEARGVSAHVERDRRPRAGARAVRDRGAAPPAARLLPRAGARAQGAPRHERRRIAERIRRLGGVERAGARRRLGGRARRRARRRARADGRRAHRRAGRSTPPSTPR